jgi:hypothetical protein
MSVFGRKVAQLALVFAALTAHASLASAAKCEVTNKSILQDFHRIVGYGPNQFEANVDAAQKCVDLYTSEKNLDAEAAIDICGNINCKLPKSSS